jgi:hypothetical protein
MPTIYSETDFIIASRLRCRKDLKAARAWYHVRFDGDVPRDEPMPRTVNGIIQRLREAGE